MVVDVLTRWNRVHFVERDKQRTVYLCLYQLKTIIIVRIKIKSVMLYKSLLSLLLLLFLLLMWAALK